MREKKFTAGPWNTTECSNFSGTLVAFIHKDNKTLFQSRHNANDGEDTCNADSNLIAAAPELLESLEMISDMGFLVDEDGCPSTEQIKIEAAIARAYGEDSV